MKNLEAFEKKYLEKIKQTKKIPDFNSGDTISSSRMNENLNIAWDDVIEPGKRLIFGDYGDGIINNFSNTSILSFTLFLT